MTPHDVWRSWTFQLPVVAGLAATAWVYGRGVRRLWRGGAGQRGRGVSVRRVVAFGCGFLAIAVALISPLDAMSDALLSVHMAQHLLLLAVAGPLLVLGAPGLAFAAAFPPAWRTRLLRLGRSRWIARLRVTAGHPVATWTLALVALWVWHLPALYQAALRSESIHAAEHCSFLGSSILFWWTALSPGGRRRLLRGADVLYVVTGSFQSAALGALFTFASLPLYPLYSGTVGAWGLSPLQDQQLAGVIMWIPSGLVYLAAASSLFVGWLRAAQRAAARADAGSPALSSRAPVGAPP